MIRSWSEFGRRVGQARKAAGITQSDLAAAIGLDRTAVSKIESGTRRIDSLELAKISDILRRPVSWFLMTPSPPVISRRHARDGVEQTADVLLESLAADVEQLVDMGMLDPPEVPPLGVEVADVATAEQAALAVRRHLGVGFEPLPDIQRVAEQLGLYLFVLSIDAAVQGSYIALRRGGVALIQGDDTVGRRRFTAAHELGHHVLSDEYSTEWIKGGKETRERLISAFAVHLLLPRPAVDTHWKSLHGERDPFNAAVHLGARFGLSWSALCGQLARLGVISEEVRARLSLRAPMRADFVERELVLIDQSVSPSIPAGYAAAVVKAFRRHRIGQQRALELLHGTLDAADLPAPHDVPMDAMLDELAPL